MIENNRPSAGEDGDLRAALGALDPPARDKLRRVLIPDQPTGTLSPHSCSATATRTVRTGPI